MNIHASLFRAFDAATLQVVPLFYGIVVIPYVIVSTSPTPSTGGENDGGQNDGSTNNGGSTNGDGEEGGV
jgi:hypothetical protein